MTIGQVSQRTGLTIHTLRYYDKEGLMPFVDKTNSGVRDFKESDFEWLSLITCLKQTGMSVKEIKIFIDCCMEGDSTLEDRLNMFLEHKKKVECKMDELQRHMKKINHKIAYYQAAVDAGTESKVHK